METTSVFLVGLVLGGLFAWVSYILLLKLVRWVCAWVMALHAITAADLLFAVDRGRVADRTPEQRAARKRARRLMAEQFYRLGRPHLMVATNKAGLLAWHGPDNYVVFDRKTEQKPHGAGAWFKRTPQELAFLAKMHEGATIRQAMGLRPGVDGE